MKFDVNWTLHRNGKRHEAGDVIDAKGDEAKELQALAAASGVVSVQGKAQPAATQPEGGSEEEGGGDQGAE